MKRLLPSPIDVLCVSLCVAACSRRDADVQPPPVAAVETVSLGTALLATIPDDPVEPAPPPAVPGLHSAPGPGTRDITVSERGGSVAFVVDSRDASRVVHDGRPGKAYPAVGAIALSPDGRRVAHGARVGGTWRMVVDGKEGQAFSAVKLPVFSPDGMHVAYQAMAGDRWHLVVDGSVNGGTRTRILKHAFGGDSSRIVFVDDADDHDRGRLVVSDLGFERPRTVAAGVSTFELDAGGTRVAAVAARGNRTTVLTFRLEAPERVATGALYDAVDRLVLGPDGASVAYVAERAGRRLVVLNGDEEPVAPGDEPIGQPSIRPDGKAVGTFVASGGAVALHQLFADAGRGAAYDEAEGLTYRADGGSHAFAARRGASWFVVVDGVEGPSFDRVVTPSFSPDGERLVYRARQHGARFVVAADRTGGSIRRHDGHEQVFPVRFAADGRSIGYVVKDGRQLLWKAEGP